MTAERPSSAAGLCATCANARLVRTARGSAFVMCELPKTDARFHKYPPLPVLRCEGYERLLTPET